MVFLIFTTKSYLNIGPDMSKPFNITICAVLLVVSFVSCVSSKKFRELEKTNRQNMIDRDDFKAQNLTLTMQNRELETKIAETEKELDKLKHEMELGEADRKRAAEGLATLTARYSELQNAHEQLIKGNVDETKKLLSDLQAAEENLRQKELVLRQLEQSMDLKKISLDEMTHELEKKNARMAELEKLIDSQRKIVQELKNKVSAALLGFENNGLTVTNKNGKVYVSLEDKLLFRTASWDIDANGKSALKKLAGVLEKNPDIQVMIEGHTDNVPYNPGSGPLKDNWDLSVKRATTVVRVLLEGSNIKPERLTAAGRGEYYPLEPGNSPETRQKNRRTEIILAPDLTELYKVIDKY